MSTIRQAKIAYPGENSTDRYRIVAATDRSALGLAPDQIFNHRWTMDIPRHFPFPGMAGSKLWQDGIDAFPWKPCPGTRQIWSIT